MSSKIEAYSNFVDRLAQLLQNGSEGGEMMAGRNDKLIQRIVDMSENEAKKALAEILTSYANIGYGDHTKDKFYKDVDEIYKREYVYPEIMKMTDAK